MIATSSLGPDDVVKSPSIFRNTAQHYSTCGNQKWVYCVSLTLHQHSHLSSVNTTCFVAHEYCRCQVRIKHQ